MYAADSPPLPLFPDHPQPLLLDGAMGTMLQKMGLRPGEQPELWNVTHPERLFKVHRAYIEAGSEVIYTNTFGANALKLRRTGYSVEQIVTAGVRIAKQAALEQIPEQTSAGQNTIQHSPDEISPAHSPDVSA